MKKLCLGMFILCVAAAGCATTESIEQYYAQINWKDGISRNEAALIAKKYLTESKYAGDFQILAPVTTGYENLWRVSFLYKNIDYYEKVLDVYVDTATGEVKTTEIRDNTTPAVTKDPWDGFNNTK